MAVLREALVALTYPLVLTLVGLVVAAIAWRVRWHRIAAAMAVLAIGWSVVWSVPRNSEWLRQSLEDRHAVQHARALPVADAIVVLGGGGYTWLSRPGVTIDDLKYSRLAEGARLFFADRAPRVILSGGGKGNNTEAGNMARGMRVLGVPRSALLLEARSHDTEDNARNVGALARQAGVHRILLVTSAVHMPRASLLFRRNGMDVFEVPVPEPTLGGGWADQWLPSGSALWRSGRALKEYAGLVAVWLGADKPA